MLTLLIALAATWTLFWLVKLVTEWSKSTSVKDSKRRCARAGSTEADKAANRAKLDSVVKTPVADEHDQVNVVPLLKVPAETSDPGMIAGIGVVSEKSLNDLEITNFGQFSRFKHAKI